MKMIQIKSGKSVYRYRLDWLVVWSTEHFPAKGKKPEYWNVRIGILIPPNITKPVLMTEAINDFEFDTEADAIAAVSVIDISATPAAPPDPRRAVTHSATPSSGRSTP